MQDFNFWMVFIITGVNTNRQCPLVDTHCTCRILRLLKDAKFDSAKIRNSIHHVLLAYSCTPKVYNYISQQQRYEFAFVSVRLYELFQ